MNDSSKSVEILKEGSEDSKLSNDSHTTKASQEEADYQV